MASRMERYQELDEVKDDRITSSRTSKNRNVYDELYNNATYTEFTDVNDRMVVELDNIGLIPGEYTLDLAIESEIGIPVDYYREALRFQVYSNIDDVGVIRINHIWNFDGVK